MISVVIPAYNEAENIGDTIRDICKSLQKDRFEIIVVDDHSSDDTLKKVQGIPNVRGMRLSRRCGSMIALRAGIESAKGNAVICVSADGQDDPSAIPQMIQKWENGAQIVWALRKNRQDEPMHVKVPALLFYKILNTVADSDAGMNGIDLSRADFFLVDRKVAEAINSCKERNTSLFGLIVWSGFNQNFVEYDRKPRRHGKSKWNFTSRFNLAKDWIIAFSGLPLKVMVWIGFIIAFAGFSYALFILFFHLFYGHSVEGWSSLMVVTLILGGINISILGVVGEYLWRNLDESRKRPLYFVEKVINEKEQVK